MTNDRSASRVLIRRLIAELERAVPTAERKGNPGLLAALRRLAGQGDVFSPEAAAIVERFLGDAVRPEEAEAAYIVASLFALYPYQLHAEHTPPWERSFGRSLRAIAWREDGSFDPGIERRFMAMLDTPREELPHHLRHGIQLLAARRPGVPVDFVQLFEDLLRWEAPGRPVQRRWAEAFWRLERPEATGEAPAEEGPTGSES